MSSTAEIGTPVARRSPLARVLLWMVAAVLVILLGVAGYAFYIVHSALPQLDGRLHVSGLSSPVTVTRDSHGVPTIEAATLEDLFFAQGFVTAQDRLWQMDLMRRFAGGELSEVLGDQTLPHDREQRILGL
jgi:penicillin G amidase